MKKICKVILAAAAVAALAVPAMAADKLIVKNAAGTGTAFKVDDAGTITVRNATDTADVFSVTNTGYINLPIAAGLGRGAKFLDSSATNNFAAVTVAPDATQPNQGMGLVVVPRGTGFNAAIKAQLSIFNTDQVADPVNYESLVVKSGGTLYSINSVKAGTGLLRPIAFQINGATKLNVDTTGSVQIGTASLATTATDGFPYIPTCAGTPTGVPTAVTGFAPMVVDSTNSKLYVYVGGSWKVMN